MNTLMLWSNDVDVGTIWDGEWELNTEITGQWALTYLSFNGSSTFPWMWNGVNTLLIDLHIANYVDVNQVTADAFQDNSGIFTVIFPDNMFMETDKDTIATLMINTILASITAIGGNFATMIANHPEVINVVYNNVDELINIQINFPNDIFNEYVIYRAIFYWSQSGCAPIFGQTVDEDTGDLKPSAPIVYNSDLITTNITLTPPKFLEVIVNQSIEFSVRSKSGSFPNFIVTTDDIPILGQELHFLEPTSIIDLQFYSPLTAAAPIHFDGEWLMVFQLKSLD